MNQHNIQKNGVAVIDIGTSAIRLVVAQIDSNGAIERLETLHRSVALGEDVFSKGKIRKTALNQAVSILADFKSIIDGYGITKVQAVATSAVRAAANRDNFTDRVFIRTGIDVEVTEGPEQTRLTLIAVENALKESAYAKKGNAFIIEVGSGSTEIILLSEGNVEITRTLSLGSMRLPEGAVIGKTELPTVKKILKRNIGETSQYLAQEFNLSKINQFIALGSEMRFIAREIHDVSSNEYSTVNKEELVKLVNKLSKTSIDEIVLRYGLDYNQAESLCPTLLMYLNFLDKTNASKIIIPTVSIRDGLLLELAQLYSSKKRTDVARQVVNSAKHLGEHYHYDSAHARCVAQIALKLFDKLKDEHGMGSQERMLLEVSAILHDIGTYISQTSHHKHSSYLVNAAEIFGLRKSHKNIVANVVRYHRRANPRSTHEPYMSLPRLDRAVVTKLASILRVADALDRSHQQKVKDFNLNYSGDNFSIIVPKESGDVSLERNALQMKGDMFEDTFGVKISLKQGVLSKESN